MSYFDDNEHYIIYGGARPGGRRSLGDPTHTAACDRCGKSGLKWRINDADKWQLFEEERGDHNRKLPHQCDRTTLDDFEAL